VADRLPWALPHLLEDPENAVEVERERQEDLKLLCQNVPPGGLLYGVSEIARIEGGAKPGARRGLNSLNNVNSHDNSNRLQKSARSQKSQSASPPARLAQALLSRASDSADCFDGLDGLDCFDCFETAEPVCNVEAVKIDAAASTI
jgi:hypothetical protein